jgi:hypothetical protein
MTHTDPYEPHDESNDSERPRNERKERVLHTRISHRLADDIGRMADELRVPVSNLVRNVLEEVFSVVETVTDNVGELIEDVMDEAGRARERARHVRRARERRFHDDAAEAPAPQPPREDPPDVLGGQPLILARAGACADCAKPLARGERAYVGVGASGPSPHTLCADCLDARRNS